jgi:anti-sigma28 factor (negative regulator of flagellin synthesis)
LISQVDGSVIASTYAAKQNKQKKASAISVSKQGDMSKIEKIRDSILSGEYKVNIQALSEKIADELL